MKIGIVTLHSGHNYGAMLQAYAVQRELMSRGHTAPLVHRRAAKAFVSKYERDIGFSPKDWARRLVMMTIGGKLRRRFELFEAFLDQQLIRTRRYETDEELLADPPDMDAYVFGSDQIWNTHLGLSTYFCGAFTPPGSRMISYAPSLGNDMIREDCRSEMKELLLKFEHLSVREEGGRKAVADLTGRNVSKVIDPVFLIPNETWDELAVKPSHKGRYIAFYSLESSARTSAIVRHLAWKYGMPVIILGKAGTFAVSCRSKIAIDSGPREFLGWLRHAALIVTNSFHATAFAVKFEVPFITIAHSTRNARMQDLLGALGLEDRLVAEVADLKRFDETDLPAPLPAQCAESLARQVAASRAYLDLALGDSRAADDNGNSNKP